MFSRSLDLMRPFIAVLVYDVVTLLIIDCIHPKQTILVVGNWDAYVG